MEFLDYVWEDNDQFNSTYAYIEIKHYGFLAINCNVEQDGTHVNFAFYPYETEFERDTESEYEIEMTTTFNYKTQKDEISKLAENIFRTKVLPAHQQKNLNFLKRIMKIGWKDVRQDYDADGNLIGYSYTYHNAPQEVRLNENIAIFSDNGKLYRYVPFDTREECLEVLNYIFNKPVSK